MTVEAKARDRFAQHLMDEFAEFTGLSGDKPTRRYLWTDAFAVCNFLGLHRQRGEGRYLDLALRLVDQVHHVLGRHRPDDTRQGWIGGRSQDEGERHPTRGGLRIGKPLPERAPGDVFDERLEWDRDGQYFHYLTQWLHALHRVHPETGQPIFQTWAVELAQTAHAAFVRSDSRLGAPRMVWKMSIDLDRVLVPSTGQHDPLDAWIAYLELRSATAEAGSALGSATLDREIEEAAALCRDTAWATDDPLGIGALLTSAYRLAAMIVWLANLLARHRDGVLRGVVAHGAGPTGACGAEKRTRERPEGRAAARGPA